MPSSGQGGVVKAQGAAVPAERAISGSSVRLRGRACHPQQMRSDGHWIWLPGWLLPFDVLIYGVTRVPNEAQR